MHSFFLEDTCVDEGDFHGLELSFAVLQDILLALQAVVTRWRDAYGDQVSDMALHPDELEFHFKMAEDVLTISVMLRCCSNSALANCRMSFRAPSSGIFAVLRTISLHRASARCRWMNFRANSEHQFARKGSYASKTYMVKTNGALASSSQP